MAHDPLIAIVYGYGVRLLAAGALPIPFRALHLPHRLQQPAVLLLPLPPEGEVPGRRSVLADHKLPVTAGALTFMRDLMGMAGAGGGDTTGGTIIVHGHTCAGTGFQRTVLPSDGPLSSAEYWNCHCSKRSVSSCLQRAQGLSDLH